MMVAATMVPWGLGTIIVTLTVMDIPPGNTDKSDIENDQSWCWINIVWINKIENVSLSSMVNLQFDYSQHQHWERLVNLGCIFSYIYSSNVLIYEIFT